MSLTDFHIQGYRSVRNLWLKLKPVSVIVGPNGSGKTNLYQAMNLLSAAAGGRLAKTVAEGGGLESLSFAGSWNSVEKKRDGALSLSIRIKKFEYNLQFKFARKERRHGDFVTDPIVNKESVFLIEKGVKHQLLRRSVGVVKARNRSGKQVEYVQAIDNEAIFAVLNDPVEFPHLYELRDELLGWRFYHHFRTDAESRIRKPQYGVMTPILSNDGSDLAAVLMTIQVYGDAEALDRSLKEAFPDAEFHVSKTKSGFTVEMVTADFSRPIGLSELSDGTLKYLCLVAALLSVKAAPLVALNEPETSLHQSLIEPLARLIVEVSKHSQIWVTTHSTDLADLILDLSGYAPLELKKVEGETRFAKAGLGGYQDSDESFNDSDSASDASDNASDSASDSASCNASCNASYNASYNASDNASDSPSDADCEDDDEDDDE